MGSSILSPNKNGEADTPAECEKLSTNFKMLKLEFHAMRTTSQKPPPMKEMRLPSSTAMTCANSTAKSTQPSTATRETTLAKDVERSTDKSSDLRERSRNSSTKRMNAKSSLRR